ncbi:MAG: multidrug ABC transporter ATP-binding protein [Chloroflexota bacterium]
MMMGRPMRDARPEGSSWVLARRAAGLFRPYRWAFAALVVLLSITTTFDLVAVRLLGSMVDEMAATGDVRALDRLLAIFVALVIGSALLGVAQSYTNQVIGQGVMLRLRSALHEHLQRLSARFYTQTRTGEILSRISTDVNAVQQSVTGTFTEFLQNVLTLTIAFALMFLIEWRLALATLLVLPFWVYPTMRVGQHMRDLMRAWHQETAKMSAHLEETLSVSGSMVVRAFGRQEHERDRFEASNRELYRLAIRRMMAGRWFNMATGLFGALIPGLVYWYGGRAVIGQSLTPGDVVAFAMLVQRVFGPFASIARINTTMLSSLAVFERIFEYLDMPVEVEERADALRLDRARGAITFDHVTFGYGRRDRLALDDVSFEASPGMMVALVGPSGAGKTTTTYLLQRFYDPTSGVVRLDGHDLRDLTLDSLSRNIGTVMQDTHLFHASLADNIRYGRLDATDAEVRAAADAAGLAEMIDRTPDGLDTVVGERGYRLSGGEQQRVAIARAILKDAPVLILDEATASLDSRLEREIREATARLSEGRTTVVIAHRLSTVVAADLILVFEHGRVVERGRHEELLGHEGLYASLYREQFREGVTPHA